MASWYEEVQARITALADKIDADFYAYFGELTRDGAERICAQLQHRSRKNIVLMVATYGGDANAAYIIGRRIQSVYGTKTGPDRAKKPDDPSFTCFVPWICKSAGSILALGADRLVVSADAELGPIDVQVRRHDEVGERTSGLTSVEALTALQGRSKIAFLDYFKALRFDPKMSFSTKLAADIAGTLTVGLFKPIYEQLDPVRLAEMERTQRIAAEYGKRLDAGNLKDGALLQLLSSYPSHGFIIDRAEMKEIFSNVEDASPEFEQIESDFRYAYRNTIEREDAFAYIVSKPRMQPAPTRSDQDVTPIEADDGSADGSDTRASAATDRDSAKNGKTSRRRKSGDGPELDPATK
jgi:hypothetical protein